jgi:uncharacterized damage-inducible protein DinB
VNESMLARIFAHNRWANRRLLEACVPLPDGTLDAAPDAGSPWTIRSVLVHLVESQAGYLSLLTVPREGRKPATVPFAEILEHAERSAEGLLALARGPSDPRLRDKVHTRDSYVVEPWVVMVQAVNHAADHRRQVCAMLRTLGVTPPRLDGWGFGEDVGALIPPPA